MRRFAHCTVALLLLTIGAALPSARQDPRPAPGNATFNIFFRGTPVGVEQVTLTRTADGWTISSRGRIGPPFDLVIQRHDVRYDASWTPLELTIDATRSGQPMALHTTFGGGAAQNEITQGGQQQTETDAVSPATVVLPNGFFGAYEALAARLAGAAAGAELRAYVAPQAEIVVRVTDVTTEQIRVGSRVIAARRHRVVFVNPSGPLDADVWSDDRHRLLRVSIPLAQIEAARADIVSATARVERIRHPGDEDVRVAASGFSLAATITRPRTGGRGPVAGGKATVARQPTVILVPGSGPTDRDETAFGIPIFGQIAGALADRGFLVARYDKRGVGQSGGRAESATLADYAEDVRSMIRYLEKRRDVDRYRIAIAGHSEGGWVAMLAAAREEDRVRALVLAAAAGTTGAELILEQQQYALARLQLPDAEKQVKVDLQRRIHEAVLGGSGWDSLPPDLRQQADTAWFRSLLRFDPARVMHDVRQPILIVQGLVDRQVPPHHADRLLELAKARRRQPVADVVRVEGVNHLLVPATTGDVDEYPTLSDRTVSVEVTSAIADWLRRALRLAPGRP